MTPKQLEVVNAAQAWARALENEYRARLIAEVPTVVIDEKLATFAEHKRVTAEACAAELRLLVAVRAIEQESR